MAYSAPELLLVGAAESLVLGDSDNGMGQKGAFCLDLPPDEDGDQYSTLPTW